MMSETTTIRQVDEKHVLTEVEHLVWSPKMDLIAVASVTGEVVLHRLSWQKVWTLPADGDHTKVTAMAWRPDGKVLAVGYDSGRVQFCDVENCTSLHTVQIRSSVTFMSWTSETPDKHSGAGGIEDVGGQYEASTWDSKTGDAHNTRRGCKVDFFVDESERYLAKLPAFSKSYSLAALSKESEGGAEEVPEDAKKLKGQTGLNILLIGTATGRLELFAYGIFKLGEVDVPPLAPNLHDENRESKVPTTQHRVISAALSEDFGCLSIAIEERDGTESTSTTRAVELRGTHRLLMYRSEVLSARHHELNLLALKFGAILTLEGYLDTTISQMSEAWEDILLEMDSKLMKLAEHKFKVCGGSVSKDFLRLLLFGTPSDELRYLLQFELTDKNLKKLGHSIETSYTNIQRLLLKHLQTVGQSLLYHLTDLKSIASIVHERYPGLGLEPALAARAVSMAGAFMLKTVELQQVIDSSLKNFKAFFRWLYIESQRLSEDRAAMATTAPAGVKMSQQDLKFVAQFLKDNFTKEYDAHRSGFKLEKVGQYLKNVDLQTSFIAEHLIDVSSVGAAYLGEGGGRARGGERGGEGERRGGEEKKSNPWTKLIQESSELADSPILFPSYPDKSLIQVRNMLTETIEAMMSACSIAGSESLRLISTLSSIHPPSSSSLHAPPSSSTPSSHSTPKPLLTTPLISSPPSPSPSSTPHTVISQRHAGNSIYTVFTTTSPGLSVARSFYVARTWTASGCTRMARFSCGSLERVEEGCRDDDDDNKCSEHGILDLSFYDENTLSLLLQESIGGKGRPVLLQLMITTLLGGIERDAMLLDEDVMTQSFDARVSLNDLTCFDITKTSGITSHRALDNMKAAKFAVSGTRKVACVLFASRRRVRLFLLDVDDDESTLHTQVVDSRCDDSAQSTQAGGLKNESTGGPSP